MRERKREREAKILKKEGKRIIKLVRERVRERVLLASSFSSKGIKFHPISSPCEQSSFKRLTIFFLLTFNPLQIKSTKT